MKAACTRGSARHSAAGYRGAVCSRTLCVKYTKSQTSRIALMLSHSFARSALHTEALHGAPVIMDVVWHICVGINMVWKTTLTCKHIQLRASAACLMIDTRVTGQLLHAAMRGKAGEHCSRWLSRRHLHDYYPSLSRAAGRCVLLKAVQQCCW
jgi:hypothetical protein